MIFITVLVLILRLWFPKGKSVAAFNRIQKIIFITALVLKFILRLRFPKGKPVAAFNRIQLQAESYERPQSLLLENPSLPGVISGRVMTSSASTAEAPLFQR